MAKLRSVISAPDFPSNMAWLNTDRPLSLRELRGKIVLLDFWTFCCINCMHVIPDLKRLEEKYADSLVVIGVHSAKFVAERDTDNVRRAILRYEVEHPVVNDSTMVIWRSYGVSAWPTAVLIDPEGHVAFSASGEGVFERFDPLIDEMVREFDARGLLRRGTPALQREREPEPLLAFPGKALADALSGRLFVADSNHNRIVVLALRDAAVLDVFGSGEAGMKDGAAEEASFNHPQGMALAGNSLYVADTENHAIRAIDIQLRTVETVAGTGVQAGRMNLAGPGRITPLNSPWDLAHHGGSLFIAMAGCHQIWRLDLATGRVEPHAGSGREARTDGPLMLAALAQPSGITTDGARLYFADSESSSIRSADVEPGGSVHTIVGGDLFDFGDHDDFGLQARLQHPLGVAWDRGVLYVADTYNNRIKRVLPDEERLESVAGTGQAGFDDGEQATFNEPGGLSAAGGRVYIADTNNHAIRVLDPAARTVETLAIREVARLKPRRTEARALALPEQSAQPGEATLVVSLELPPGHKVDDEGPSAVIVASTNPDTAEVRGGRRLEDGQVVFEKPELPLRVKLDLSEGHATLRLSIQVYYCNIIEKLCLFGEQDLVLPLSVREGAGNRVIAAIFRL